MAQLNVTADKIQLTTNMITSEDAATAPWSDAYYPSAKAVADKINAIAPGKIEHPIGSVLITSTNVNPGASVGGTWELLDKEYKNEMLALTANVSAWTAGSANLTSGYVIRANHSTRLKLVLTTTTSLSAGTAINLGTISPTTIGADSNIPLIAFGTSDLVGNIVQAVNKEGTETYDIQYNISANGLITITKIFNNKTLPVGTVVNITTFIPMVKDFMADWACDKFYWKRTK